ncbi:MAG: RidA family protein [Gammaproteobacteria bacterium]|nr:RidA family protein [Gammaproteobacteria bacterium]MDH3431777.1 RidA family protein [Gammaproteobacteria bacterium]MDH3433557.1 RidA family protein [Gammaproteobacteria bacterium]
MTDKGNQRFILSVAALAILLTGCSDKGADFEYIHLPGTEPAAGANMPFTSAIRVRSGSVVFMSGVTAAPVPHSHPHKPAEFDHLDFSPEAQTEAIMNRLNETLEAAGGQITDIVQVTRFVVDVENNQNAINQVMNRYWGDNHRPASTTVEIVRLATDPRFILELEAVAVLPD